MSSNTPPPSRDSSSVPPAAPVRSTDGSAAPHDTWFGGRCDERLLADIVETSRDGIAAFDLQCRYTVWNAEMERISGVPRSRTIGVVAWDAFPFLKDIGEDRHFHRALAGEQSVATERPFHVPQTGRQGFFDAIYAPLYRDGRVVGGVGFIRDVTEQKRTRDALRDADQRLKLAMEAGRMGAWEWTLETNQLRWTTSLNGSAGGRAPATFAGTFESFMDDIHPADRARVVETIRESLTADHDEHQVEYRMMTSDGTIRWVEGRGMVFRDADSRRPLRVLGISTDITERKRIEEALRLNERRLRKLIEQSPMSIQVFTPDGRPIAVNAAWERLFGVTLDEIEGYNILQDEQLVRRGIMPQIRRAFAGEHATVPTIPYVPDRGPLMGQEVWCSAFLYPVKSDDGQIEEVVLVHHDVTAERKATDRLHLYRQIFANSNDGVAIIDPDGRYVEQNAAHERMAGYADEDLRGRTPAIHLGEEQYARIVKDLIGNGTWRGETLSRTKDGREVPVELSAFAVRNDAGEPVCYVGVKRDITEQKRTEEALRDENRVAETLRSIGLTLAAELELDKLVQSVTDAGTRVTGAEFGAFFHNVLNERGEWYTLYTISGAPRSAFERFPMPRNTELFGPTFRGEGTIRIDDVTADPRYGKTAPHQGMPAGHLAVRSYLAVPVKSRTGEVLGGLFFGHSTPGVFSPRDARVIEGLAAQASIAIDNARLFEAAQQARRQAEHAADRIARVQRVTAALAEARTSAHVAEVVVDQGIAALGASAGSLLLVSDDGTSLEMLRAIGYPPHIMEPWQRFSLDAPIPLTDAVKRGEPVFLTSNAQRLQRYPALVNVRANATTQSSACIPLLIGGRAIGVMGLSFDREGPFAPDDQEFMVSLGGQCAQALERARLYEAEQRARAAAERANTAKDQFLAVLSHELRTPLTPVLATVSVLEHDASLPPDVREDVRLIRRNVELEARLIDDLLDLTRIARGKLELSFEPIDVHDKIDHVLRICEPDARAKGLLVELRLEASRHHISGDPARVQQMLWNLLKNAIKFTAEGGHVDVRTRDGDDGRLVLEIIDDGVGIEPDVMPRLFNAFEQGGREVTRMFGGLGLGLAISKALAEAHQGELTAASAGRGKGATFTVTLPTIPLASTSGNGNGTPGANRSTPHEAPMVATPGNGDRTSMLSPSPSPSSASLPGNTKARILLVEDHPDTSRIMARLLERDGYRVEVARSVAAALDAASATSEPFDLIISDIGLPDGTGLDLMQQLLQRRPIKGIALSGFGMEEDVRRSHAAGFSEHLTKPVNLQRLQSAIAKITG